jgi:hypothetical protein
MINNHVSNAMEGALIDAQQRLERGEDISPLDLTVIEEESAVNAGREFVDRRMMLITNCSPNARSKYGPPLWSHHCKVAFEESLEAILK